jgi:hypothetical protein
MGAKVFKILVLHFKQNVSHFTPEHIFGAGKVRASRVKYLPSQALFPNPKVQMYMYMYVCIYIYIYIVFYFIE